MVVKIGLLAHLLSLAKKKEESENVSVTHHTRIITLIHRKDMRMAINDISCICHLPDVSSI